MTLAIATPGPQSPSALSPGTVSPGTLSPGRRALYAIPVVGQVARDIARDVDAALYAVVIFLTLVILAVMTWGLPALVLTAVALVPMMFSLFIWITLP